MVGRREARGTNGEALHIVPGDWECENGVFMGKGRIIVWWVGGLFHQDTVNCPVFN